jgi:CelD/BcsL family acetyltransferase involved in cellulose biosynthesis
MKSGILRVTSPAPVEVWEEIFRADPEAVPYQSPAWFRAICRMNEYADASRLYELSGGRRFILPLVRRRALPARLSTAASMPSGWGMGGLIGGDVLEARDVTAIFEDLAGLPYLSIGLRPNPRAGELYAAAAPANIARTPRRAHVIDLAGGYEYVWQKLFTKQTRKNIRYAEKMGVTIEVDTTGRLMPVFYDLLRQSFDRWAEQQNEPLALARWRSERRDPFKKFEMIAREMGDACRVLVAWFEEKPVAAGMVLQYHNINDSRFAMDKELAAPVRAGDLLQMVAIRDACEAGCRFYHLGESGNSAGLDHYKSRFGAVASSYAEYHIEKLPLTSTDRQLRGLVKRMIGFKDA